MVTLRGIYNYIDSFAPFALQDGFDNSGLLINCGKPQVGRVLLALDVTVKAVDEALNLDCDAIITHHPVIFHKLASLDTSAPAAYALSKGVSVISAHTNLDSADYNISDMMCDLLGFDNTGEILSVNRSYNGKPVGYGRIATCEPMTTSQLVSLCKKTFGSAAIRYTESSDVITRVAMCSGAGGEFIFDACAKGVHAYITADVRHHEFLDADRLGIAIIDCSHYETEVIAMRYLKDKLSKEFPEVEFVISNSSDGTIKGF